MMAALTNTLSFESSKREVFFTILQVLGASLFLALCSQICIPLYFSPVPISGQTFGVMLIGATLGSRKGLLSVLAYISEGFFGLPVFVSSGVVLLHVGYFAGFLFQAYFVGWFVERLNSSQGMKIFSIMLCSCALQLGLGVVWLSLYVGLESAMIMGFFPFVFGEFIKAIAVTAYVKRQYHHPI